MDKGITNGKTGTGRRSGMHKGAYYKVARCGTRRWGTQAIGCRQRYRNRKRKGQQQHGDSSKMDARIQGLYAAQAATAWEECAEIKRQAAIYLIEREQEQSTVQAQGWEWDGAVDEDEDKEWCEEWDGNCYWVDGERSAEVKSKVRSMVVKKNSKKKMDVAKEENGERLIK